MKVLFSPIGSTDPITNQHDGGLLHICRVYQPDKIYLYYTAEMCRYRDMDDRYRRALKLLGKHIGWTYEVEEIRAEEMVDVQLFDLFIKPFEKIVDKIMENDKPEVLYVNVSSGTPAMKSALQTISILWNDVEAIQVSTPEKSSNTIRENKNTYDVELQWECNADNEPDFENRCVISHAKRLLDRIRKESICEYIEDYDYEAAKILAAHMSEKPSETFMKCLDVAIERQKLTITMPTLFRYKKELPVKDWFAFSTNDDIKDFEYLLVMQIKMEKKQYVDFCRDITPILFSLSQRLLKKECNLTFEDIGNYNKKQDCYYLSIDKLNSQDLLLNEKWTNYNFISSEIIIQIIEHLSTDKKIIELLHQVRDAEKKVRNKAAHEIVGLTHDGLVTRTNQTPQLLMDTLFQLAIYAGINITKENRHIYQTMNRQLCDMIRKDTE